MNLQPKFRSRVLAREWLTGTFINLGSPVTAECAGHRQPRDPAVAIVVDMDCVMR